MSKYLIFIKKSNRISDKLIRKGRCEYMQLLKRVAYYEMFGYDEEVKFI